MADENEDRDFTPEEEAEILGLSVEFIANYRATRSHLFPASFKVKDRLLLLGWRSYLRARPAGAPIEPGSE